MTGNLNARQAAFVDHFVLTGNATQSAIAAGYSENTAKQQGNRLPTYADIRDAVEVSHIERIERVRFEQDTVLAGLLTEATRTGKGASHPARVAAWTAPGKHLNLFIDRSEISGADGGPIRQLERIIVSTGVPRADDCSSPPVFRTVAKVAEGEASVG